MACTIMVTRRGRQRSGVRTRSLLTVAIEHSLYGITIFTIGLGRFFYHDA
jgi:hypothetical protein